MMSIGILAMDGLAILSNDLYVFHDFNVNKYPVRNDIGRDEAKANS